MVGGRNKCVNTALIGPSAEFSARALWPMSLMHVCYVEIFRNEVHLHSFKGRVESAGDPTDCIAGDHCTNGGCQIANRINLRLIAPIRIGVLTTLPRLFGRG